MMLLREVVKGTGLPQEEEEVLLISCRIMLQRPKSNDSTKKNFTLASSFIFCASTYYT